MFYEFMRMMAGSMACTVSDFYIQYQLLFNSIILISAFSWTLYKKNVGTEN